MKLRAGAISDIGRARERNEDSYLLREPLFAVADGMGGHRGGDVASALALESFDALDPAVPDVAHALVERVKDANRRVLERSLADRALRGMGTTLTAIVAGDDKVYLAHVGDSRAYLLRDGVLQQLSEDHTLVQRMVREGRLSSEEAAVHPQRSILTRAIGVEDDIAVDQLTLDVHRGDRILLCSDGLTSMVDRARIQEILNSEPDPQAAAQLLVEAANRAGGDDNITAIVVDVQEASGDGSGPPDGRDHRAGSGTGEMPVMPRRTEGSGGAASDGRAGPAAGVSTAVAGGPDDVIGRAEARASTEAAEGAPPSAPAPATHRFRWRRAVLWVAVLAAVVTAAVIGTKVYLDRQWYVGVDSGTVAIYNGIPSTPLGFRLSHVAEATELSASLAERLQPYADLAQGITADSRKDAEDIVLQIRQDLQSNGQIS